MNMDDQNWIGQAVSIQCDGSLGVFQGTIKDISMEQITIVRAFRNGVPLRKQDAEVTLSASDIRKIELIPTYNAPSTVAPTVINKPTPVKQPNFGAISKKSQESILANKVSNMKLTNGQKRSPTFEKSYKQPPNGTSQPSFSQQPTQNSTEVSSSSLPIINNIRSNNKQIPSVSSSSVAKFFGNMIPSKVEVKMGATLTSNLNDQLSCPTNSMSDRNLSKPIEITAGKPLPTNNSISTTPMKNSVSDRKVNKSQRRQDVNSQTFGTPVDDPIMDEEFDFEGNLALFDKQAIWDTIEAGQKPDLVRQAVSAQRNKKYRHDENILTPEPIQFRQIQSHPQDSNSTDFVTDEGLIIPTIPLAVRNKIQDVAERNGLTRERQMDIMARGIADLAILLLGGARRLTPNNRHQWPKITIISDKPQNDRLSEIAATTGRQLASHGLKVCIYIKDQKPENSNVEVELFKATDNSVVSSVSELPSSDLVILSVSSNSLFPPVKRWIGDNRSVILAIDPPVHGLLDVNIKASILPILPLNSISMACGKLYLCNLGIPDKFYRDAGIKYKSPFGHKFVIPIHTNND
ncbi:enhancer of mRNA-decapping protein 3 [Condylostylus longicornis]|uniref:enhancer of mRNA-decapping protein 3 n=1 Tax=Condylostylus longicornis TaxID=2530218 RepID=UPI00244D99FF|nr:enhancer of mRNA-decapping protein 3 [Condylostylus longicornis]